MSTSLSEQLKRLALPQTQLLQKDKKKPSLLFEPKEAAGVKRETVYQIGLDGLEELIGKNEQFEQFKNNLFHISSKKFERAVETSESNRKLDKLIRKFLLQLSPFFLLNCSHKALEWLINRYHIHEYNREDVLMLILPYHESNIFVRFVQLMKFKDTNDSWFFLKSLQKPGVHLSKQSLLTHAANDVYFLKFVGKLVHLLVKQFDKPNTLTVAFNFYCAVYVGAIEYSKQLNEAQITQMLPTLIKGLNSDIADYCAASYIILGRLVMKTQLTDLILNKFVEKVAESKVEALKTDTVLVLLILYQSQKTYSLVPEEACRSLVQKEWLPKILQDLNKAKYFISPLLEALLRGCLNEAVKMDNDSHRHFVNKILAAVQFEDAFVGTFLSLFLDVVKPSGKRYTKEMEHWSTEIVETLERQYPDPFDKEVYKILSTALQNKAVKKRKIALQSILAKTMNLSCKFNVLDKLYHPNPSLRSEALSYLQKNFNRLREREREMIKSSFIDRLNDDDINVVKETLTLARNLSCVKDDSVKKALINLLYKAQANLEDWQGVATEIALVLCENTQPDDWESFVAIFPFLLPNSEQQLQEALKIVQTAFIAKSCFMRPLNGKLKNSEQFSNKVFDSLRNDSPELVDKILDKIQLETLRQECVLNKYLTTLILSCMLPSNSPISTNARVVRTFIKSFETCQVRYEKSNAFFQKHLSIARKGIFQIEAFLLCLRNVILKTQMPNDDLGLVDFSQDNSFNDYFLMLANALFKTSQNHKKYILFFVNYFCKSLKTKIEFLLNLALSGKNTSVDFASVCLDLISRYLFACSDATELTSMDTFLPYLLSMLLHRSEEVKERVFKVIQLLVDLKVDIDVFGHLLAQKEEIIADSDQVPLILFNNMSDGLKNVLINAACKENPLYIKDKSLELLSMLNSIEVFELTSKGCLSLFSEENLNQIQSNIIYRNILRCQANVAQDIKQGSFVWKFLETCFKKDTVLTLDGNVTSSVVLLLEQFNKEFFGALKQDVELKVFDLIIEVSTFTKNPKVLPCIRHIIRILELDAKLILPHFVKMRDVQSPKLDPSKLKRRISIVPTIDILDTAEWKKGQTALEFIQDKKKLTNINVLLPVLFDVLKKCLDFDEQAAVEYPKQLILSSILYLSKRVEKKDLSEAMFNMELVVQCIRASQNPQTHYCALLVLAFSAELFPAQVLHNIMAIFTFMGSSLLRYEDAYSFQIISKIIDTIVPILVQDGGPEAIAKVLRVFVDALLDVPEQRRMPVYVQLLETIGTTEYLHLFLLLIFESHVNHRKEEDKRLEIAANISREFSPKLVIQSCISLVQFLKELPDEVDGDNAALEFDIRCKTPKHFRHFKYTVVIFVSKLLASQEFVLQVASLQNDELLELEQFYKDMIVNILTYIHRVSKVAERSVGSPQAKYWKVILHLCYDILDSVNAILTPQMFLLVIKGLMLHNFATVRRRSMELLNAKLQNSPKFFEDCTSEEIYVLVSPLLATIKNIEGVEGESEEELIVQTALLSLKLLAKLLVNDYPEKMIEILNYVTDVVKSGKAQNNVLASVLLCLAEIQSNLRAHSIQCLPNFMPALLKILKQEKSQESSSLLLLSSVTAVQKILETLPLFLSPYLEKLLFELSLLSTKWSDDKMNKLAIVRKQLGRLIPPRVLIPTLSQTYNRLIAKNAFDSIAFLMDVLAENLSNLPGPEINANLPELTNFFLNALQFRAEQEASFEEANEVEAEIVKALTRLVLKLSEGTFKPLYYKLFDWAARHEQKTERLITFYSLSSGIAEALKSLFVLFAGHFLNNAAHILDCCNAAKSSALYFDDEKKDVLLLESVLKTLHAVFVHDNQKFVNKDRFEVLMQPLVDQLENNLGSLSKRNEELLTPTIVQFAVATADDSLWKQLNYQVLLKMKHNSANIRLISLHCLKELVKKLGVDYLPLLPETIPVLAELLEDEEESVEKACRKAVQEMEKILGEPIEKYFKM